MEKDKIYILIAVFFVLGLAIGYVAHKPETIEKIKYINTTIEVPIAETVTPTPISAVATATPTPIATSAINDFTVKSFDPSRDIPTRTVEFVNWRADPGTLSIHTGDTVLFKITDFSLPSRLTFILNASYTKDLGTIGSAFVIFNRKGTYSFKAIIPSGDPTIIPRTYAEGTITVY